MIKIIKTALTTAFLFFSIIAVAADPDSPTQISGATAVSAAEAKKLFDDGAAFVDVRKDSDYEVGRVPGAIHIALDKLSEELLLEEVDKNEKVVFYCNGVKCLRSSEASKKAVEWGFTQVFYFREGLPAWKAEGYHVE